MSVCLSVCPSRRGKRSRLSIWTGGTIANFFISRDQPGSACISLISSDLLSVCLSVHVGGVNYLGFLFRQGTLPPIFVISQDQPESACISLTSPDLLSVCLSVHLGSVNYQGCVAQKGNTIDNFLSSRDQPASA